LEYASVFLKKELNSDKNMRRTVLFLAAAMMLALVGCNNSNSKTVTVAKTTENDAKMAEAALFNSDMSTNNEEVPEAIEVFSNYAADNPEAENAAEYLFKALEVSINTKQDPKQSIDLADRLLKQYPKFDKAPVALFMMASFVYEDQLNDLDKAKACYQRIVDEYPDSPFAKDAAISIQHLGMSPEELIKMFEANE